MPDKLLELQIYARLLFVSYSAAKFGWFPSQFVVLLKFSKTAECLVNDLCYDCLCEGGCIIYHCGWSLHDDAALVENTGTVHRE